jgi:hypothetical protein
MHCCNLLATFRCSVDYIPSSSICEGEGPILRLLRKILHELPFLSRGTSMSNQQIEYTLHPLCFCLIIMCTWSVNIPVQFKKKLTYQLPCGDRVVCFAIRFCGWSCTCMCSSSASPSWERWRGRNGHNKNLFSSSVIQEASRLSGDLAAELNSNLLYYWQITVGCLPWNSNLSYQQITEFYQY